MLRCRGLDHKCDPERHERQERLRVLRPEPVESDRADADRLTEAWWWA